jgi:membrane-associated protein
LFGGLLWAVGVTLIGYLFGNIPFIKNNLEVALIAVIFLSLVPIFLHWVTERRKQQTV